MEKTQVESSIQSIRLWKRYRASSFFTLNNEKYLQKRLKINVNYSIIPSLTVKKAKSA